MLVRLGCPFCKLEGSSVQFSSVAQSCPTLCDPMNCSMPGLPVHHQLPESTQTHVHRVVDAIQPSHPLSSPSPLALNLSQHQGLFQRVSSSNQVAKVLEFQLQHRSFQWTCRPDLLLGGLGGPGGPPCSPIVPLSYGVCSLWVGLDQWLVKFSWLGWGKIRVLIHCWWKYKIVQPL